MMADKDSRHSSPRISRKIVVFTGHNQRLNLFKLFFQMEDGGRRGHDKKLFKNRFRLDVQKCF